jgi:hypothetical protein
VAKEMKNSVAVYMTDFGNVILPDDFPSHAMRKNGWPDRRRKIAGDVSRYIEDLQEGAFQLWQAGRSVQGESAMSFAEWQKK